MRRRGRTLAADGQRPRFRDHAHTLTQRFATRGVAMLAMEVQRGEFPAGVSPMVDNILLIDTRLADVMKRTIRILKTRGSGPRAAACRSRRAPPLA